MFKNLKKQLIDRGEIYFRVKIHPGTPRSCFKSVLEDGGELIYKLDIAAPPVQGKANQALISFLAKEFSVDKNNVKIINGAGARNKLVKVQNK